MERDFNNDEFELFLKQKVDQHKLFPSDNAWKGIYNSLHPGMRWFKIGGSLLVITALLFISQETSFFRSSKSPVNQQPTNSGLLLLQSSLKSSNSKEVAIAPNSSKQSITSNNNISEKLIVKESNSLTGSTNDLAAGTYNNSSKISDQLKGFILKHNQTLPQDLPITVAIPASHLIKVQQIENTDISSGTNLTASAISGSSLKGDEEKGVKDFNWLQELAAIKLTPQKKSRFNLQFYFSPTISYRRLDDNQNTSKAANQQNIPMAAGNLNINKYVDHSPSIGAELGSNILFSASRNLTFKSGLQLNYSRYNIKAFKFYYEKASIALNTAGPVADTITSYTSFRNFNGYAPEQLQNQYLQVSVPIGAELKLLGNKRLQLNVAGTIQPTFLLFSDTYLLSSNYLNYTKEPSLVRKWNVHSSFEAFLSYKTGGVRWQLGPQFRYQLLSSYNDRYPIKEYLFEYGVKIGVSKTLR